MRITTISPKQLHDLVQAGEPVELVDVRTPVEFREVHVSFARNVPLDQLDPSLLTVGQTGSLQPLYMICRSGCRVHECRQCGRRNAGLGSGGPPRGSREEGDLARTPGPDRCRSLGSDGSCAGVLCQSVLDWPVGIHRCGPDVCRDHGYLRSGDGARPHAVESGSEHVGSATGPQ